MKGKGQASFEFLATITLVMVLVVASFALIATNQLELQADERFTLFDSLCTEVAEKINNAFRFRNGFAQAALLPAHIFGRDYNITVAGDRLQCLMSGVIVRQLSNDSVTQGVLAKKNLLIINDRGSVRIS